MRTHEIHPDAIARLEMLKSMQTPRGNPSDDYSNDPREDQTTATLRDQDHSITQLQA